MKLIVKHVTTMLAKTANPKLMIAATVTALMVGNSMAEPLLSSPLTSGDNRLELNFGATIVAGGVEVDTTSIQNPKGEWFEYLRTKPDQLGFESGKSYRVSYDYTVTKAEPNARFYSFFRSSDQAKNKDQDFETWTAPAGSKGHKAFIVTLPASDYHLTLGIRNMGAIHIKNLRIEEFTPPPGIPFSGPIVKDYRFSFAGGVAVVVGGVEVDTTLSTNEWHEYLRTVPAFMKFESGKTYRISYDYTVKKVGGSNMEFYHMLRKGIDYTEDLSQERWADAAGNKGHKEFTATVSGDGYYLILGVHFGGAIRIENLKIEGVAEPK